MRISFDLDDTLIYYGDEVPCEPSRIPFFLSDLQWAQRVIDAISRRKS